MYLLRQCIESILCDTAFSPIAESIDTPTSEKEACPKALPIASENVLLSVPQRQNSANAANADPEKFDLSIPNLTFAREQKRSVSQEEKSRCEVSLQDNRQQNNEDSIICESHQEKSLEQQKQTEKNGTKTSDVRSRESELRSEEVLRALEATEADEENDDLTDLCGGISDLNLSTASTQFTHLQRLLQICNQSVSLPEFCRIWYDIWYSRCRNLIYKKLNSKYQSQFASCYFLPVLTKVLTWL